MVPAGSFVRRYRTFERTARDMLWRDLLSKISPLLFVHSENSFRHSSIHDRRYSSFVEIRFVEVERLNSSSRNIPLFVAKKHFLLDREKETGRRIEVAFGIGHPETFCSAFLKKVPLRSRTRKPDSESKLLSEYVTETSCTYRSTSYRISCQQRDAASAAKTGTLKSVPVFFLFTTACTKHFVRGRPQGLGGALKWSQRRRAMDPPSLPIPRAHERPLS